MRNPNFKDFFKTVAGDDRDDPYAYQERLAGGNQGKVCESQLIDIPTGLGKTAAVVIAWLWNRVILDDQTWPRRLVYCLPMRTLVEQTQSEVKGWMEKTAALPEFKNDGDHPIHWLKKKSPVVLLGGEKSEADQADWDLYPEREAILIGTQDMLLSRALNRGYGMSRYRWPMHFGLLNNDCLWVLDETQLMGSGMATGCQLEAFRSNGGFGPINPNSTWYMSATANPDHLNTRDGQAIVRSKEFIFKLLDEEKNEQSGPVHQRRNAVKRLVQKRDVSFCNSMQIDLTVSKVWNTHQEMLTILPQNHQLPTRTIVICNTVDRAIKVHSAFKQMIGREESDCELILLHSRFRPPERKRHTEKLNTKHLESLPNGQIVIATQVIEAGVDVSSGVLCSEIILFTI